VGSWRALRTSSSTLTTVAGFALLAAAALLTHRSAAPCSGSLRRAALSTEDVGALPVVGRPGDVFRTSASGLFDTHVAGEYALGAYRLRYAYDTYGGRPAPVSFELDAPRSCDGGSIAFGSGMYLDWWTLLLRDAGADAQVITFHDDPQTPQLSAVAFRVQPPGILRSAPRYAGSWLTLAVAAALGIVAVGLARRARARCGPSGVAGWREGRIDADGSVEASDGGPPVAGAPLGLQPGTPVLFASSAPRPWSFRRVGQAEVLVVEVGSRAEILARYARVDTTAAKLATVVLVVAAGVAIRVAA
jgi:hypothetical protein